MGALWRAETTAFRLWRLFRSESFWGGREGGRGEVREGDEGDGGGMEREGEGRGSREMILLLACY